MGFNEKAHAFISAMYYKRLTEKFDERGRKAFVHATQHYATQRGNRMAQRAIRDGVEELDFEAYVRYGEWVPTQEAIDMGCQNRAEVIRHSPDYVQHITQCTWHTQYKEMDMIEGGHEYCSHLDSALARGFNPYLCYEVKQSLHKSPYCIHVLKGADFSKDRDYSKQKENLKGFDYHCAHCYWAYAEIVSAIFGDDGVTLSEEILLDFAKEYGAGMTKALLKHKDTNFNVCD